MSDFVGAEKGVVEVPGDEGTPLLSTVQGEVDDCGGSHEHLVVFLSLHTPHTHAHRHTRMIMFTRRHSSFTDDGAHARP